MIYAVAPFLRDEIEAAGRGTLRLDLAPDRELPRLIKDLSQPRGKKTIATHLQRRAHIDGVKAGLLREIVSKEILDPTRLAAAIKSLPLTGDGAAPIARGDQHGRAVTCEALDKRLMLKAIAGGVLCGRNGGLGSAHGRVSAHGLFCQRPHRVPVPWFGLRSAQNVPKHELSMDGVTALIVPGIGNSGPGIGKRCGSRTILAGIACSNAIGIIRCWTSGCGDSMSRWLDGLSPGADRAQHGLFAGGALGATSVSGCRRGAVGRPARSSGGPAFPSTARGFETVPSDRLPFPSLVVASSNDAFGSVDYAKQCAVDWGSAFVEAGAIGHINAESDLGAWPAGFVFLTQLLATRDPAILHNECC